MMQSYRLNISKINLYRKKEKYSNLTICTINTFREVRIRGTFFSADLNLICFSDANSNSDPSVDQALASDPTCTTRLTTSSEQNDFPSVEPSSITTTDYKSSACKTSLSNICASLHDSERDSDSDNYYTGQIVTEVPVLIT